MGIILKNVNITGGKLNSTVEVPTASTPVGATLMQTGQTTSYRTGDDGDLKAGRATDFFTLASNNPFGNPDRFTDELSGQTYTNDIVIDWSTYDGATVLGWRRTLNSSAISWNDAIDEALTLSIGGYTNGWRLPNVNELCSLINWQGDAFTYSPFNIENTRFLLSSTTNIDNTSQFYRIGRVRTPASFDKLTAGANNRYIPCRTFTVIGTSLT